MDDDEFMEISKSTKASWIIKDTDGSGLTLTASITDNRITKIFFDESRMEMDYNQFQEFYRHFSNIKTYLDAKYLFQDNAGEMRKEGEIPLSKFQSTPVPALLAPEEVIIPEVYILTKTGLCLFHFDFSGTIKDSYDQNLVSGLISAINMFAQNMGWLKGVSLIKSGNTEVRFVTHDYVIVALITNASYNYSYLVEPIIADLAAELAITFETKYQAEITDDKNNKIVDVGCFEGFQAEVEDILIKYRKQTFELYQKLILTEAMYLKAPQIECVKLIQKVTGGKNVISELAELMKKYPIFKDAIHKVNVEQRPMWQTFNIPIYEV